jgi:hypothetical protein
MGQKQHTGSWIKNNVEASGKSIEQMADRMTIQALPARIFKLFL